MRSPWRSSTEIRRNRGMLALAIRRTFAAGNRCCHEPCGDCSKIDRLFGEGVSCLVRLESKAENRGGSVCESNTPATSEMPPAGFEDRESHRTPCASE